ncbi:hypothetical protein BABINDRAFT_26379, partial [Babjeviella inositovora NRRL Y-12698]
KKQIDQLPSQIDKAKSHASRKLAEYLDSIQDTVMVASKTLNDVTGYSGIAVLKESIENLEELLARARGRVKASKEAYAIAISERSASQKEVNELLQRKHTWTSADLMRFTELFQNDHVNEKTEGELSKKLEMAEHEAEEIQLNLTQAILTRYHEEQIWSDKIRRTSTWGTFVIMGINVFLFLVVQLLLEPWKRKRLVGSFEEKVKQALAEAQLSGLVSATEPLVETSTAKEQLDLAVKTLGSTTTEPLKELDAVENTMAIPVTSLVLSAYYVSFKVKEYTWNALRNLLISHYYGLKSPESQSVVLDKIELGVIGGAAVGLGCVLGSVLTNWL